MTHRNNPPLTLNIPILHPDSLLDLKVNAKLLTPPCTEITFQFSQIDWQSYNCEPNGVLINDHYPPNHQSLYGNSALVEYRSMEITNISRKENYENEKTIGIAFNESLENIHNEFENQGLSKPFVITVPDDIIPDMLSKMVCTELPKGRPIVIYSNSLFPDNTPKLTHIAPLSIQ